MKSRAAWVMVFLICFSLISLPSAHAYVDPGTGSYIFQVVIGVFLGAAVAVKLWWRKLWSLVRHRSARDAKPKDPPDGGP
jgi:hypothetical protein